MLQENNVLVRRILMIVAFFGINFGLWEILVKFMSKQWASFSVSAILFVVAFAILGRQLREEWFGFVETWRSDKRFIREFFIFLIGYFVLGGIVMFLFSKIGLDVQPQNSDNVGKQLQAIPVFLTFIQTCLFAPIIEEMTFRYSIIGHVNKEKKWLLVLLSIVSIVLFDVIHIFTFKEFFYYLFPAIAFTVFYVRQKNVIGPMILHSVVNIIGTAILLLK